MRNAHRLCPPLFLLLASAVALAEAPAPPEEEARQDAVAMLQGRTTEEILPEAEIEAVAARLLAVRKALPELASIRAGADFSISDLLLTPKAKFKAWMDEQMKGPGKDPLRMEFRGKTGFEDLDALNEKYGVSTMGLFGGAAAFVTPTFGKPVDLVRVARRYEGLEDFESATLNLGMGHRGPRIYLRTDQGDAHLIFEAFHPGGDWGFYTIERFFVTLRKDGTVVKEYYEQRERHGRKVEPTWPLGWQHDPPERIPKGIPLWAMGSAVSLDTVPSVDSLLVQLHHDVWWAREHAVLAAGRLLAPGGRGGEYVFVEANERRAEVLDGIVALLEDEDAAPSVREALLDLFPEAEANDAATWRAWLSAHPEATRPR